MTIRCIGLICAVAFQASSGSQPAVAQGEAFNASGAMEVVDLIHQNHIDPPTRQELVLSGLKALRPSDLAGNALLSTKVSESNGSGELQALIEEQLSEWEDQANLLAAAKRAFVRGAFQATTGRGEFFEANEARINGQLQANQYVGVGIALTMEDGIPLITKSFYHGPGYKGGVRDNDSILEIDGLSTKGKTLGVVVEELRGERGTEVELVLKNGGDKARKLNITRDVTFIPTVEGTAEVEPGRWRYLLETQGQIAYLRVVRIGPSTVRELKEINAELMDRELEGLVLDMRSGGGTLHDTLMLADQFLGEGPIGQLISRDTSDMHKSRSGTLFSDIPMAVLVDARSGAGNSYLAAALQDRKRAVVVGTRPQGPMLVKSQFTLSDGSQLQFATGILKRSNGELLSLLPAMQPEAVRVVDGNRQLPLGLNPDVEVRPTGNASQGFETDPYVIAAVKSLTKKSKIQ